MDDPQKIQKGESSELEQCQKERDEYLNGWKRAKADLINYQKEEGRRAEEAIAYANTALVRDLVSLIDSFELAKGAISAEDVSRKGLELIANQFEDVLRRHGAIKITAVSGDAFDPRLHEAVGEVELSPEAPDSQKLEGKIVQVLSAGYQLRDRVLRPARVRLGKIISK